MKQERLFPYVNPLGERLGAEFFKSIPRSPGVYLMQDAHNQVLYVGKAKDLRSRLLSYRRAKPEQAPRKVIRMLHRTHGLRWEVCESETAALLRENHLLRTLKPFYNVQNTRPETYYFIGVQFTSSPPLVRFRLTTNPNPEKDLLYGAYKGRGLVRKGYAALLRLLWMAQTETGAFDFPAKLVKRTPCYDYELKMRKDWEQPLKQYLRGSSEGLLGRITAVLLQKETIPRFIYHVIQEDLSLSREFFDRCLKKNRRLKINQEFKSRVIPQDRLDDLIVLERHRQKEPARPTISTADMQDLASQPSGCSANAMTAGLL